MQKPGLVLCGSLIFVFVGWWLMASAWNGVLYVYVGEMRSPAAVKQLNDFLPIDGRVLRESLDKQMFENVSYIGRDNEVGIRLGHFLVRDASGKKQFACQVQSRPGLYDRVELSFMGVGVSDNGKIPKMTVESACAAEDELSYLNPIWLGLSEIYQSEPKTQELVIPELGGTSIRFEDLASAWPERWTLVGVKLYRADLSAPALSLEPKLKSHDTLSFNWKKQL
jgi:hypothetical protein